VNESQKHGVERFAEELEALGYRPQRDAADGVWFDYTIENGPRHPDTIELGFVVPGNFPVEPPHGPNFRPAILRSSGIGGVHPGRELGRDWDHWSRPHPNWAQTDQSVRTYMRHIRSLNEELPARHKEEDDEADAA
jgi:hypothetical protein